MHASPPSHEQNIVHYSLEQLQAAVWQPELLQLHLIIFSIPEGAQSVPEVQFREEEFPDGHASSHIWLDPYLAPAAIPEVPLSR